MQSNQPAIRPSHLCSSRLQTRTDLHLLEPGDFVRARNCIGQSRKCLGGKKRQTAENTRRLDRNKRQSDKAIREGVTAPKDGRMGYLIQNLSAIDNPKQWKSNPTQPDHVPQRLKNNGEKIKKWEIPVDMNPYVLQCSVESGQLNSITSGTDVTSSDG